jgi:hypothetical protein
MIIANSLHRANPIPLACAFFFPSFFFSLNASETICKQFLPKSCWGVWSGGYRHVGSPNENGIFRCRIFQFLFGYTFVVISGPSLNI